MKPNRLVKLLLLSLDALTLTAIFCVFTTLRHQSFFIPEQFLPSIALVIIVMWTVLDFIKGYSSSTDMMSLSYTSQHVLSVFVAMVATIISMYVLTLSPSGQFSRSVMFLSYPAFIFISLLYRRAISSRLIESLDKRFFLVIGTSELAVNFCRHYSQSGMRQKLRFIDLSGGVRRQTVFDECSTVIEGMPDNLLSYLGKQCDGIIIAGEELDENLFDKLIDVHFNHIPVMPMEFFYEKYMQKVNLCRLNHLWLLDDGFLVLGEGAYDKVKRLVDIFLSVVGLILTSPLFLVVPVLIRVNSGGAAIFRQPRVGKDNIAFELYKFRTMHDGSECGDIYTQKNDSRITSIGSILRKSRLDELPQLWNVLKGDMSIIGPRAEWIKCVQEYEKEIPYYHFRHLVKPGITGWAQVNYPYGQNLDDTLRKLEYDLFYVRHHSPFLDAEITLKTVYVMLFGKGAM